VLALLMSPAAVVAEPIKLKLAFHTSDTSNIYQAAIKPFVDAVNADGNGVVEIDVYFSGALNKDLPKQWQLVRDGTADIAFVIPGQTPARFPDTAVIELPGLYRSMREATLVFTHMVATGAITDYQDFFVIGAFATEPESIHTRPPIASLADLKGKRIRANNPTLATTLAKLGMTAVVMPVNLAAEAISSGKIDGASVPVSPLFEYGIGRVTTFHYFLPVSSAPFVLLMNRKTFDGLPKQARDIIRKYSGEWAAERFIETFEAIDARLIEQLKSDSRRKLIVPSPSDADKAAASFNAAREEIVAENPHLRELLRLAQSEIARLRSSKR
jgi:TRAP-type C4-dicarboxylate transport system substrate-binding protein